MLSPSQKRILRWLGKFSSSLEDAWDVPRELSLPGLSESLGVVRSALHAPLNALMENDLIICRLAHVVGGGSRRRNVYHITLEGRKVLENLPEESIEETPRKGKLKGEYPESTELKGRDEIIENILDAEYDSFTLVGIPGIGKTVLARHIASVFAERKISTRWVRFTSFDDANSIGRRLMEGAEVPEDPKALASLLNSRCGQEILVFDDVQDVHERHSSGVGKLFDSLQSKGQKMILISRAPAKFEIGEVVSLEEVSDDAAMQILGEDIDEEIRKTAVEHIGGHPLALHMWNPEQPLAGAHIRRYVEETVLTCLPEFSLSTLDEVAVLPRPIDLKHLSESDGIGVLDDHALLRWSKDSRVELQHLVRNVRRETWSEDEARKIHARAVEIWSKIEGEDARLIEFHMRNNAADEDIKDFLELYSEILLQHDSAAMASLVDDACNIWPDAIELRRLAVHTALERGEHELAKNELQEMEDVPTELLARVARQNGRQDEADEHMAQAMAQAVGLDKVKLQIAEASRILEDALPDADSIASESAAKLMSEITLNELDTEERRRSLVAMASVNHWIALNEERPEDANKIRGELAAIAGENDHVVIDLKARAAIRFEGSTTFPSSNNLLRETSLLLMSITNLDNQRKRETLQKIQIRELCNSRMGRRLAAITWFWKGVLEMEEKLTCWREAIHLYTAAECTKAAKELTMRMHALLR